MFDLICQRFLIWFSIEAVIGGAAGKSSTVVAFKAADLPVTSAEHSFADVTCAECAHVAPLVRCRDFAVAADSEFVS